MKTTILLRQTIIVYFLWTLSKFISAQNDTDCHHDMKSHMSCMRRNHEENQENDNQTIRQAQNQIIQCFVNNKCTPPDFDEDLSENISSSGLYSHRRPGRETRFLDHNIPELVRQCMKENMRQVEVKKLNQCLQKHGVAELGTDEDGHSPFHSRNETIDAYRQFFMQHEVINHAIISCKRDTDEDVASSVAKCFHNVRSEIKRGLCPRIIGCEKEKVRPICRQRGSDIRKALCKCRKDCLREAIRNIDDLTDLGRSVDRKELLKAVGRLDENHKKEIFENLRQCYTRNGLKYKDFASNPTNSDHNPILRFVDSKTKMVSLDELNNIKFILTIKYRDEECDECNN